MENVKSAVINKIQSNTKKRRLNLKEEKRQGQEYQENLEGISYGVDPFIPLDPGNIVEVPEPVLNPGSPSIGIDNNAVVIFDLETTGFGKILTFDNT